MSQQPLAQAYLSDSFLVSSLKAGPLDS